MGVIAGMLLALFGTAAVTRGPTSDVPGEATTSVLGVVVDRVPIPAAVDGIAVLPTDRIMRGVLVTMIGGAVGFGIVGGLLGWAVARWRRPRPAGAEAFPDPPRN